MSKRKTHILGCGLNKMFFDTKYYPHTRFYVHTCTHPHPHTLNNSYLLVYNVESF